MACGLAEFATTSAAVFLESAAALVDVFAVSAAVWTVVYADFTAELAYGLAERLSAMASARTSLAVEIFSKRVTFCHGELILIAIKLQV